MNLFITSRPSSSFLSVTSRRLSHSPSTSAAENNSPPNKPLLYASLLQACTKSHSFTSGRRLHAHVLKAGLDSDRFVGNSILSLYFKLSPTFRDTRRVFDGLPDKDVVSWTSLISGYVRHGSPNEAISMFDTMLRSGMAPNAFALSATVKACAEVLNVRKGAVLHGMVLKFGVDDNEVVGCSLIDMYGRNSHLHHARRVFDEMVEPDEICWTSVISAFVRNDVFEEGLRLFYLMQRECGLSADGFTFGAVLTACGHLGRLRQGREVHGKAVTAGFRGNVVVESSIVDMYGKCGAIAGSRRLFDLMPSKNAVSWCALLAAYCQNNEFTAVLDLFRVMDYKEGEHYSFGMALRACAGLAAVRQGKEVHCQYVRKGSRDVIVESALIDLYSKCGSIGYAYRVFERIASRNLITWNSMISGFAHNGAGKEAIDLFNMMVERNIKPDHISFIGVFFACSHSGLVAEGRAYFKSMKRDYGIEPDLEHYNCLADLLGRAGFLEEAETLIESSLFKNDTTLWATLLGACTAYSSTDVAERIAKKMADLKPNHHLGYTLLGNVYRAVGEWDQASNMRKKMEERGLKKMPGRSWIEGQKNIAGI